MSVFAVAPLCLLLVAHKDFFHRLKEINYKMISYYSDFHS